MCHNEVTPSETKEFLKSPCFFRSYWYFLKLFLFVQISVDSFDDDVVIDGQNDDIGGLGKNFNLKKRVDMGD